MAKRVGANQRLKMQEKKKKISSVKNGAIKRGWKALLAIALLIALAFGGYSGYGLIANYVKDSDILKIENIAIKGVSSRDSLMIIKIIGCENLDSIDNVKTETFFCKTKHCKKRLEGIATCCSSCSSGIW